jgi:hypothetical protein
MFLIAGMLSLGLTSITGCGEKAKEPSKAADKGKDKMGGDDKDKKTDGDKKDEEKK